jgi:metal-sulfur cluster biosynthetic enzyme
MERGVSGGPIREERRLGVFAAINQVVDPCSAGVRVPIGVVDMGLVESVNLDGGRVSIELITTAPFCLFTGLFEEEIQQRVSALPWVESVQVAFNSDPRLLGAWDEERMSADARAALAERFKRSKQPRNVDDNCADGPGVGRKGDTGFLTRIEA